jgi:catechol 2,3-dioxygenase-like lactoylglutathione lyase family enzyme
VPAIRVLGIDHVVLRVANLERSLAFYETALGCAVERRLDELGLVQLRAGSALIDLVPLDSPLGRAGGGTPIDHARNMDHVALQIERFEPEALRAHLGAHGLEPGDVASRYGAQGNGPSMYLRDPDGNTVELKGPPEEATP